MVFKGAFKHYFKCFLNRYLEKEKNLIIHLLGFFNFIIFTRKKTFRFTIITNLTLIR